MIKLTGRPFLGQDYANFTEAEAGGTVGLHYQNGYTYLDIDTVGDHVVDAEIADIKGIIAPDLIDEIILVPHGGAVT